MRRVTVRAAILGCCAAFLIGCGGDTPPAEPEADTAARDAELETLRAEKERLEREVALRERREKHAEEAAERARQALADATQDPEEPAEPAEEAPEEEPWRKRVSEYPAYEIEEFDEALGGVDWVTVGGNMSAMAPLIAELAEAIASGKPLQELPPDLVGRIQQLNGPLVTAALNISQKGVPGTGVNGSFSHPAFMGNAVAASLEAIGMPLSEEQSSAIEELSRDFSRRDDERRGALDESVGELARICDESDLRRDFFAQVHAVLSEEQHAALRPEITRGRLQLDIYCESLLWTGRAGPVVFTDRAELVAITSRWITNRAGLQGMADDVGGIVDEWVAGLTDEFLDVEVDSLSESGMMHVARVAESGRAVLKLQDALVTGLALDEAATRRVRAIPGTIVLYRRAGPR